MAEPAAVSAARDYVLAEHGLSEDPLLSTQDVATWPYLDPEELDDGDVLVRLVPPVRSVATAATGFCKTIVVLEMQMRELKDGWQVVRLRLGRMVEEEPLDPDEPPG